MTFSEAVKYKNTKKLMVFDLTRLLKERDLCLEVSVDEYYSLLAKLRSSKPDV
jgi:hypothetical protein